VAGGEGGVDDTSSRYLEGMDLRINLCSQGWDQVCKYDKWFQFDSYNYFLDAQKFTYLPRQARFSYLRQSDT